MVMPTSSRSSPGESLAPVVTHSRPSAPTPLWAHAVWTAILSGGLMAACYWPLELHWLAWVAMVPWLVVLPRLRPGHAGLGGFLLALVHYRIGLAWLFSIHGLLAGCALVILSVWTALAFRVARMLMARFGTGAMLWAVPLAFVGQEVLRCEGLPRVRFPFLAMGYSQSHNLFVAQIASLGGVYLLTLLIVAVNSAVAYAIVRRTRRAWVPAVSFAALVAGLGAGTQPRDVSTVSPPTVSVACVQAEDAGVGQYVDLTRQALADPSRPRLVVLPEHTIDNCVMSRHPLVKALSSLAGTYQAYICVGADVPPAAAAGKCDNVGMLIGPDGNVAGWQVKSVPLPFFEDGNPARSIAPVGTPPYGISGVLVCYDALFTDIPRRLVSQGAELLVVPVMDPQRWTDQERCEHADMAPLRSIELRRWAVRAASSGVSQIIDPAGRVVVARTKQAGPGIALGRVQWMCGRTLFLRGGWLLAWLIGAAYLATVSVLTLADGAGHWRCCCTARQRVSSADVISN
jgi:apolipoprotein N-acyltransferase